MPVTRPFISIAQAAEPSLRDPAGASVVPRDTRLSAWHGPPAMPVPRWPLYRQGGLEVTKDDEPSSLQVALTHPVNLAVLACIGLMCLIAQNAWLGMAGLAVNALLVVGLTRLPIVASWLRKHAEEERRSDASSERSAALLYMGRDEREELESLERLVEAVRSHAERTGQGQIDVLDRILATYAELAVSYHQSQEAMATTDRVRIEREMQEAEGALLHANPRIASLCRQRLRIAERRLQALDSHGDNVEATHHVLAAISSLIRLIHEQTVAGVDVADAIEQVEDVMDLIEVRQRAWDELADIVPNDVDGRPMLVPADASRSIH